MLEEKKGFWVCSLNLEKDLRSGNIKGSINLPFQKLLEEDRTFKEKNELIEILKQKKYPLKKIWLLHVDLVLLRVF